MAWFSSILFFVLTFQVIRADPYNFPVNICTNTITPNVSKFMHAQDNWEVYTNAAKARTSLYDHYTGPATKNASYIPEFQMRRHLLTEKPDFLIPASVSQVNISRDSKQGIAQETNLQYLLMLSPDNLVYSFRKQAGLEAPGSPYGGWEAPDKELRGHFVGHYLSASSLAWSYSHNDTLYNNMNQVVDALAECQEKMGNGYLSAFPEELFDRFELLEPVWSPYYTMHKIMAGLLDQYVNAGNSKAFRMLLWMVQYFTQRVNAYIKKFTVQSHYVALNEEFGGMNEVLYNLYRITGNPDHLKLAHLFDKPCFLGLLSMEADSISGFHANTHLPIVVGAEMRYEIVGDEAYKSLSEFFMKTVTSSHMYATGGTSVQEFWSDPQRLATALTRETEETCTTYNMLKISRNLFRWTKRVEFADYYERAMTNGIMSVQRRQEPGVMIYMLPLKAGSSKAETDQGWGTPYGVMWCCYGTATESFAKLGDSIYFLDNPAKDPMPGSQDPTPGLFIIQYVSSMLRWDTVGLKVKQTVEPLTAYDPVLRVNLEFLKVTDIHPESEPSNVFQQDETKDATNIESVLNVRIPSWTSNDCQATFNDNPQDIFPGSFLTIQKSWKAGDKLTFSFPATIRIEHIQDDRDEYAALNAVFFGPYVLAGMSTGDFVLTPPNQAAQDGQATSTVLPPEEWILPVDPSNNDILYSFHAEYLGERVVLGHKNGSIVVDRSNVTGTDWDYFSTFRVVSSITECGSVENGCFNTTDNFASHAPLSEPMTMVGKLVSLEFVDQPEVFISHDGIGRNLAIRSLDEMKSDNNLGSAVFKIRNGLSGMEGTIAFEAAGIPGCYLHAPKMIGGSVQLKCLPNSQVVDNEFNNLASFMVHKGAAIYNSLSFIAQASNRAYLLFPLADYTDEHYTVYFDMK